MFKNIFAEYLVLPTLKMIRFFCISLRYTLNQAISFTNVFIFYFNRRDCGRLSDCFLLAKLLKNSPSISDRCLEYPWVLKSINITSGAILDVGSTASVMFRDLLPQDVEVYAIDLNKNMAGETVKFVVGDIRKTEFANNFFDCISCVSTLEHIGIVGRYCSDDDPSGDKLALREMKRILKVNGSLLLTIPYGSKDVLPINRLYNRERIDGLLQGFEIIEKVYLKYNYRWGLWLEVGECEAAETEMVRDKWYALCLIKAIKRNE